MSEQRGTTGELSNLHGLVTRGLVGIMTELNMNLESEDEDKRLAAVTLASPAMLRAAMEMLKMNNITAQDSESDELAELDKQIQKARSNRRTVLKMHNVSNE